MRLGRIFGALALAGGCAIGSAALAADWQIATVSGKAFRLEGAAWVRIAADEPIALGTRVRTLGSGRLTLTRDGVTVTVGPDSQVEIAERMDGKFTDVYQTAGSATVEVDPQKRIHLAVETPYMAAVVKGTVFTVSTFEGRSETAVQRGRVAVIDVMNGLEADVTAGQTAISGEAQQLSLSGRGKLASPRAFEGKVMSRAPDGTLSEMSGAGNAGRSANGNAGGKKADGTVASANASSTGKAASSASNAGGKGNASSNASSGNANGNASSNNAGGNSSSNSGSNNGNSGSNGNSGNGKSK